MDIQLMMERIKKSKETEPKNSPKKPIKVEAKTASFPSKNVYHAEPVH